MSRKVSIGSIPTLSGQLSYLQIRANAYLTTFKQSNTSKSRLTTDDVEQAASTLSSFAKQLDSLCAELQVTPEREGVPTLSLEASSRCFSMIRQSDIVLDKTSQVLNGTELYYLASYLLAVGSSLGVMLQCLKLARLLSSLPHHMSTTHRQQAASSRTRLIRRVSEQQTNILRFFGLHYNFHRSRPMTPPSASPVSPTQSNNIPDPQTLTPFLHESLSQSRTARMRDEALDCHIKRISEDHAQHFLVLWTSRNHGPSPASSPIARNLQPAPISTAAVAEYSGDELAPEVSPRLTSSATLPSQTTHRHSSLSNSPSMSGALPMRSQRPRSFSFQPSSFPPSSLSEPPFVVTHARNQAQAQVNSRAQAQVQAQAQRKLNDTPSDTLTETSSLSPTMDPSSITVVWRRSAFGHHWDFENHQLMHNTGTMPSGAAKNDRKATTEIRKSLLTQEALDESGMRWDVVERKVLDVMGSQRKKFIKIEGALDWHQVETLVRRSGELANEEVGRQKRRREHRRDQGVEQRREQVRERRPSFGRSQTERERPSRQEQRGAQISAGGLNINGLDIPHSHRRRQSSPGPGMERSQPRRSDGQVSHGRFDETSRHHRQRDRSQASTRSDRRRRSTHDLEWESDPERSAVRSRRSSKDEEYEKKGRAVIGRIARAQGIFAVVPGLLGDVLLG